MVTAVNYAPLIGATRVYAEARFSFAFGMAAFPAGTSIFFVGEEIGAAKYFGPPISTWIKKTLLDSDFRVWIPLVARFGGEEFCTALRLQQLIKGLKSLRLSKSNSLAC
jgi:hypothetical protein